MAEFAELKTLTLEAAADLSVAQYHIMRVSAANKMNLGSAVADANVIGVLQTKPKSGEFGTVAYAGKTKVVAGASITAGAMIQTNTSGRAITVVSGSYYIGRALDAANADGDVITALLYSPALRPI